MADLTIKTYSTGPTLTATLSDLNGPINLTNASWVKMGLLGQNTNSILIATCAIVSAANGAICYGWGVNDLQVADVFTCEFEIGWASGMKQIVPNAKASNPTIEVDLSVATSAV